MWMYSEKDVRNIVEDFMAEHFNFSCVYLSNKSAEKLEEICSHYGTYVENVVEQ